MGFIRIVSYFVSVLLFSSCMQKREVVLEKCAIDTGEVNILYAIDSIYVNESFSLYDWKIRDDKVVFRTSEQNDFIRVFDYSSMTLLYKFGEAGRAEAEFISHNWCVDKRDNRISLYDIMKRKMYSFFVSDSLFVVLNRYELLDDEEGLCRPFTQMLLINDSICLQKEDGEETNLYLSDIKRNKILSSHHCSLRDAEPNVPYTPFDYSFDVIDSTILIAYNYVKRFEFLRIREGELCPFLYLGESKSRQVDVDYDYLKAEFLCVASFSGRFYCLCAKDGVFRGDKIFVFDFNGNILSSLQLDKEVDSIQFSADHKLVAYAEREEGFVLYFYEI